MNDKVVIKLIAKKCTLTDLIVSKKIFNWNRLRALTHRHGSVENHVNHDESDKSEREVLRELSSSQVDGIKHCNDCNNAWVF